jgi:flagellar biosynthesis GTPase FlhF
MVKNVGKPLSYVTTGQGVPADIEVAKGKRIAQLILGSEL